MPNIQNINIGDYKNYFETLAKYHSAISHNAARKGEHAFFMASIEDVFIGAAKSDWKPSGTIMVLMDPLLNLGRNGTNSVRKEIEGGFMILSHHKRGDKADIITNKTQSEEVALDIINRMMQHSHNGHPLFQYSLDSQDSFRIDFAPFKSGDGFYTGVRVTFTFRVLHDTCLYVTDWNDELTEDNYLNENCIRE